MSDSFTKWFSLYLAQSETEVRRLLRDQTAVRFLITWSIFESDCCDGFLKFGDIPNIANEAIRSNPNLPKILDETLQYFHHRYQDNKLHKNLMHRQKSKEMDAILNKKIADLSPEEALILLIVVVYRYRNNIFHGNKGVESWLQFTEQIEMCQEVMQKLIDTSAVAKSKAVAMTSA